MRMKTYYGIGSFFWLLIGTYTAIQACRLGLGSLNHPGRGFIFFLASSLLVFLSAIDLARSLSREAKTGKKEEAPPIWQDLQWGKVLLVLGSLLAFNYLLDIAGFLISSLFLMTFLFRVIEPTRWWIVIMSSFTTVLFSYLVFKVWLSVPFPEGFLGF
jgi:hypothetical protein